MTFFRERHVITGGFPQKIGDSPQKTRFRPISSRNVHADNQTQCNDTCFAQNFDLKPLPTPSPPPSPPPSPHLPSTTLLAPPPCPFPQPLPPTICPPPTKSKSAIKNSKLFYMYVALVL